ncbi:unnamed protein product [Dibothriocephalus latus]|uniref:Uncharacterized protein n=1 Tax=Dibothriocephalus latus TaxID=60516 RepID=A0A3P7LNW8_DIBLA|nr:unnamed protein product [Dibothriocephalus latus]
MKTIGRGRVKNTLTSQKNWDLNVERLAQTMRQADPIAVEYTQSLARSFDYSRFPPKPNETSQEPLYSRSQRQLYRDFEGGYGSQTATLSSEERGEHMSPSRGGRGDTPALNIVNGLGGKVLRAGPTGVGDGIAVVTASVPKILVRSPASAVSGSSNSVISSPGTGFVPHETGKYQPRTTDYSPSAYTQSKVLSSSIRRKV